MPRKVVPHHDAALVFLVAMASCSAGASRARNVPGDQTADAMPSGDEAWPPPASDAGKLSAGRAQISSSAETTPQSEENATLPLATR
jgi:hypothetical protein